MKYEGMPRPKAKAKEPSLDTARDENRINRVNKTYRELIQQPDRLRDTIAYTKEHSDKFMNDLLERKIDRVILIGCGDSWFVGISLELLIEKLLGSVCQSFDAFEFNSFRCDNLNSNCIVIGQSASGTTASVLDSLQKARAKGAYTIGISNTDGAAILETSDYGLLIQAKREGWPTQATTAAIGALAYLFATLCVKRDINSEYAKAVIGEIEMIPSKIEATIASSEPAIKASVGKFVENVFFQTTGSGALFGSAQIACAKLRELCPVHASTYPIEEFHHYRTLKPLDPLVLFVQGGAIERKEVDTALVGAYDGGKIIVIGTELNPEIEMVTDLFCPVEETIAELQPIVSSVAAHLFAFYLAMAKYDAEVGYPTEV